MTNEYFLKLSDIEIPLFNWDESKGDRIKMYGPPDLNLVYYSIKNRDLVGNVLQTVESWVNVSPDCVLMCEMRGYGHLLPHRDHGVSCRANYYLNSTDSITYWYEKKLDIDAQIIPNSNIYNRFDDLDRKDEFQAANNEFYLLNVQKIHSVLSNNIRVRQFITFQWYNSSYDEILSNLK